MNCRHCHNTLKHVFLDLGEAPPSNAYINAEDLEKPEDYFPLKLFVCEICWLVQTADYTNRENLFKSDYAYFSSVSKTWLNHATEYCDKIIEYLKLSSSSSVIELASNDGYLLKNFVKKGIPCLGIEPTSGTADKAISLGIQVIKEFFGLDLAQKLTNEGRQADLIIGNNVYAHVPDINDFTAGIKNLLSANGVVTLEFPHLLNLIKFRQFDTVYHEHYSYLSLYTVSKIFKDHGLRIFKVEKLSTHGGSLRIYGSHDHDERAIESNFYDIIEEEEIAGMRNLKTYKEFQEQVDHAKDKLVSFLVEKKEKNETVVGYGAAAKGNTLLNYAGIKSDLIPIIADIAPAKQNMFMPGSHIPIVHPEELKMANPKWVLILPWNLSSEIIEQQSELQKAGARFIIGIPELTNLS